MQIKKVSFKMVLNISAWIFLILTGITAILILGPIEFDLYSANLFLIFLIMTVVSFSLHKFVIEYPENQGKYFFEWILLLIFLVFINFTIYIFA